MALALKVGAALISGSDLPDRDDLVRRFEDTCVDLVAVGTIGDQVPLVAENRALVKLGLARLARTSHLGLQSVLAQDGIVGGPVPGEWVSFNLVPRLNAAGRISDPAQALALLLCRDPDEARSLARNLTALNEKRKRLVDQLWRQTLEDSARWRESLFPVAVLASPYKGLMGLIATRMRDLLGRPAAALASDGARAVGSARSVEGVHVTRALEAGSAHLDQFGGHEQAAGLSLPLDRLDDLTGALEAHMRKTFPGGLSKPRLSIAGEVATGELLEAVPLALESLAPFGEGNPRPLFLMRRVKVSGLARVGRGGQHVRLTCPGLPSAVETLGFGLAQPAQAALERSAALDLAFSVEQRTAGGRATIMMRIEDLKVPG
ncbi:MAG: hypothetical protein HY815_20275 [Candidatus Riflebacteria bacterium]|nr:hypothetical protein [Candidatus Riflebacteria bacterium]